MVGTRETNKFLADFLAKKLEGGPVRWMTSFIWQTFPSYSLRFLWLWTSVLFQLAKEKQHFFGNRHFYDGWRTMICALKSAAPHRHFDFQWKIIVLLSLSIAGNDNWRESSNNNNWPYNSLTVEEACNEVLAVGQAQIHDQSLVGRQSETRKRKKRGGACIPIPPKKTMAICQRKTHRFGRSTQTRISTDGAVREIDKQLNCLFIFNLLLALLLDGQLTHLHTAAFVTG